MGSQAAPTAAASSARATITFASSGSLVLEDRRPEAQERSTGKEAHTARIPGHHLSRTWSSRLGLCSLSGQVGRGSPQVRLTACHPGTRGFIVGPCSRVRLHHSPRDLHRPSPPVAPTPHTTLWYQPSAMVLLWLLIAEGANGRRSLLPTTQSRIKGHMPANYKSHKTSGPVVPGPKHPVRHLSSALESGAQISRRVPQRS